MRNLIRHILKEETESVDRKIIKILKQYIIDYFSETDWFKDVDFEIGEWISVMSSTPIPEIRITIYIVDEDDKVRESDFSDLMDNIYFLMDMFFPRTKKGRYTAVWTMDVEPL
jgi:hypothetical protein